LFPGPAAYNLPDPGNSITERTVRNMSIAGIIVEVRNGSDASVLAGLAQMPQISVFGVKENQIVTVIEGDNAASVNDAISRVSLFDGVLGVYPVSISEDA